MKHLRARRPLSTLVGILLVGLMLFPVYWMVNASLQPAGTTLGGGWFPARPDAGGYVAAVRDQGHHLVTSLVVSLGSAALSLGLAVPAAHGLTRFPARGTGPVLLGVLLAQAVPGIVVANALYGLYGELGLLDTVTGLVLADATVGVPFAVLVLRAAMRTVPREIVEAARLDGAGPLRVLVSIVLPLCRTALVTAAVFAFLFAWSDYLFATTLTTTGSVEPVTLSVYRLIGAHSTDWSTVMATAVLASAPAAALLVLAQRHMTAGTGGGGDK